MILGSEDIIDLMQHSIIRNADLSLISAASLDFRLSPIIMTLPHQTTIDSKKIENLPWESMVMDDSGLILKPGQLYLGSTTEALFLPNNLGAEVCGKSTLGRLGITIHVTAGWVDPGFSGTVTLEIHTIYPIRIYPGMRVGQFTFIKTTGSRIPYNGRYQNRQQGQPVTPTGGGMFKV